jgi:hypothetical protein
LESFDECRVIDPETGWFDVDEWYASCCGGYIDGGSQPAPARVSVVVTE